LKIKQCLCDFSVLSSYDEDELIQTISGPTQDRVQKFDNAVGIKMLRPAFRRILNNCSGDLLKCKLCSFFNTFVVFNGVNPFRNSSFRLCGLRYTGQKGGNSNS
jgi:hypothetical protein